MAQSSAFSGRVADSLLVGMAARVSPERPPLGAVVVAKVGPERVNLGPSGSAGPPRPLRRSRAQGGRVSAELGDRVGAEAGERMGPQRPPRQSQANTGVSGIDRVGPESGEKKTQQKSPRAAKKRPAAQDTAQQKRQKSQGGDCVGKTKSKKLPTTTSSSPKACKKAARPRRASSTPAHPPSTPPCSKRCPTSPTRTSPRPPGQTSPSGATFASSPVSKELRDALPGPMSIHDLCQPAVLHLASLSRQLGAGNLAKRIGHQTWTLHTVCSGLGCPEIAGEAIQAALKSSPEFRDVSFKIVHGMKIDKNPAAQATLKANFPDSCLFGELESWLEGHARTFERMRLKAKNECLAHGKDCALPANDVSAASAVSGVKFVVMVAGPPCNPWSKRGSRKGNAHADAFAHVIWAKMVVQGPYEIVIFENVMDEELINNLHKHFSKDFHILVSVVSAEKLGYPVSRKRLYALLLRKGRCVWKADLSLQDVMDMMQRERRMSLEQLWFLRSGGLAEHADWDPDLSGWDNLTAGQRRHAEGYLKFHHGRRLWDLSQNPAKAARFETGECLMTLLTNTVPFSVAKQRALAPVEALVAHGIPALPQVTPYDMRTWKFPVSQGEMRKMAGMSMHVPSVAGVMLAAMTFVDKTE